MRLYATVDRSDGCTRLPDERSTGRKRNRYGRGKIHAETWAVSLVDPYQLWVRFCELYKSDRSQTMAQIAKGLGMPLSTLSERLSALEAAIGEYRGTGKPVKLFERPLKPASITGLTPTGEQFYKTRSHCWSPFGKLALRWPPRHHQYCELV